MGDFEAFQAPAREKVQKKNIPKESDGVVLYINIIKWKFLILQIILIVFNIVKY